jgi:hypothetical protein
MGDGVLVYFGYPQAHEDDAERAVRAGLALVRARDLAGPDDAKHPSGSSRSHSTKGLSVLAEIQSARFVILVHPQADDLIDN